MRSGKDRAHSEKTGNNSMSNSAGQGLVSSGYHNKHHSNQGGAYGAHQEHSDQYAIHHHSNPATSGAMAQGKVVPNGQTSLSAQNMAQSKKAKMPKPTITLSINSTVQNVIVTPMGTNPGQYQG